MRLQLCCLKLEKPGAGAIAMASLPGSLTAL